MDFGDTNDRKAAAKTLKALASLFKYQNMLEEDESSEASSAVLEAVINSSCSWVSIQKLEKGMTSVRIKGHSSKYYSH